MTNATEVTWSNRKRPSAKAEGHDARRHGTRYVPSKMVERTYVECECGKVYSGWGFDGGLNGWARHRKNEGLSAYPKG